MSITQICTGRRQLLMKYYVDAQRNKQQRKATKVYINMKQRKQLISEVGEAACLLYMYYLEKTGVQDFQFKDSSAAESFGWKEPKVIRLRQVLIKNNWFYQSTYTNKFGRVRITYLGKETVNAIKNEDDPIWEDMAKLSRLQEIMEVTTIEEVKANMSEAKAIWETL